METDEALMAAFQAGSREAFETLFARYRGPLYGFFRRRSLPETRAEDLTQETFLAVLRGRARYRPRAAMRTYLYAIAMNLLSTERRSVKRHERYSIVSEPTSADGSESAWWVREAIAKLERMDREILMLREFEQLSYDDIAELLKLPVNTVRSRLFRARLALKTMLEPREAAARKEA